MKKEAIEAEIEFSISQEIVLSFFLSSYQWHQRKEQTVKFAQRLNPSTFARNAIYSSK